VEQRNLRTRVGCALGGCAAVIAAVCFTILFFDILTPPRDAAALLATRVPATAPPAPARPPTVLPPTPPVFLTDDFSQFGNFPRGGAGFSFGYIKGGYSLAPTAQDGFARVFLQNYKDAARHDVSLEIQAAPAPDSAPVEYGIFFWHSQTPITTTSNAPAPPRERFLYFSISTSQAFRLRAYEPMAASETPTPTVNYHWVDIVPSTPTLALGGVEKPNRVRIETHPHHILAYINDALVLDHNDSDVDQYRTREDYDGRVGIIALALGKAGAQAIFSAFKLNVDLKASPP
jgi:hypothetical protein